MENEKGRIYNGSNRVIRNSNKALREMDREIRLELHDWSIAEALSTWNGENNTKSVGYEMKKMKKNEKKASIPTTSSWCPLLWHVLPGNNIGPENKETIILIVIIITIMIIIITMIIMLLIRTLIPLHIFFVLKFFFP